MAFDVFLRSKVKIVEKQKEYQLCHIGARLVEEETLCFLLGACFTWGGQFTFQKFFVLRLRLNLC